jgi:hypothetical protein
VHAMLPIVSEWFEQAKKSDLGVFNFPPMRKPAQDQIRKLSKGSTCLLFLYDERVLSGEFKVEKVKRLYSEEFLRKYKEKAYEVSESKFPKKDQWCWIIEFTDFRAFKRPLSEDEVRQILGEIYGKSASMRPLHFTQIIDSRLVDTIKTIMLVLQLTKGEKVC